MRPMFFRYLPNLSQSGYWFERALVDPLRDFAQRRNDPDTVVLDFGCGQKPFAYLFSGFQGNYLGLDVYPGKKVDIVYDGMDIPLEPCSVDLVFASSVFEHIEDLPHTFREINRILRPGGELVAVIPFVNHVHGTPWDYNRPTRYGWHTLVRQTFGDGVTCEVQPVDGRFNCLINTITAQLTFLLIDGMRWGRDTVRKPTVKLDVATGGASPEGHDTRSMRLAYRVVACNPINFILGLLSWLFSWGRIPRRPEGEITSGYLVHVRKL